MKSNSETSYGARIGNAEKLVAALQNFSNYQALRQEYSITDYSAFIADLKDQNNTVAAKKQNFSLAIDNRHQIFDLGETSIKKVLSPINGTVKVSFGRTAKEATDVAAIIAKIRGANIKKDKETTTEENTVSQSYQSYNARAQYFADLIAYLSNFGGNYTPVNENFSISKLTNIYDSAIAANNLVMDSFTKFSQVNSTRINSYYQLSQTAIRIKDSVKAQYGLNSTEYLLIKGLKI